MKLALLGIVAMLAIGCGGSKSSDQPADGGGDAGNGGGTGGGLAQGSPWPMFRHGTNHDGRATGSGPKAPRELWRFTAENEFFSNYCPPSIGADGTIYLPASATLYAVGPDGQRKWAATTSAHCKGAPAVAADGTIYVSGDKLVALAPDGIERWSFLPPVDEMGGSPTVGADGSIFVATEAAGFYALTPQGSTRWTKPTANGSAKTSAALAADGTLYIAQDAKLQALTADGVTLWEAPIADSQHVSPLIGSDGSVYLTVSSLNGGLYAFSSSGAARWSDLQKVSAQFPPAIAADGTLYAMTFTGDLLAYRGGTLASTLEKASLNQDMPLVDADGVVYFADNICTVHAVDALGKPLWSLPLIGGGSCGAPIMAAEGRIYVVSPSMGLIAIGD